MQTDSGYGFWSTLRRKTIWFKVGLVFFVLNTFISSNSFACLFPAKHNFLKFVELYIDRYCSYLGKFSMCCWSYSALVCSCTNRRKLTWSHRSVTESFCWLVLYFCCLQIKIPEFLEALLCCEDYTFRFFAITDGVFRLFEIIEGEVIYFTWRLKTRLKLKMLAYMSKVRINWENVKKGSFCKSTT